MRKFVVMGVAGCGKTSVGNALASRLGWQFIDGDALHPPANIQKMESGVPLTDADRLPWLQQVGQSLRDHAGTIAIGCSALKRSYRDIIRGAAGEKVCFLFLDGSRELIEKRMSERTGHFMPLSLLDSQFATLERPQADEDAVIISIDGDLASIIDQITGKLEELEA
jgi:gluconokinase